MVSAPPCNHPVSAFGALRGSASAPLYSSAAKDYSTESRLSDDGGSSLLLGTTLQAMRTDHQISLFSFLLSPRSGLPRLNGWQRAWLVVSGILLAVHLPIGYSALTNRANTSFDSAPYERRIANLDTWLSENRQRCIDAGEEAEFARRMNAEYNAKGEVHAQSLQAAFQTKIDEAKRRLFAIETSGGKYYSEWVKYRDAIDAYTEKLREQKWKARPFKEEGMVSPASLRAIQLCEVMTQSRATVVTERDAAKDSAEQALADANQTAMATAISFLGFSLGLYFVGWCIGWIRGGFKQIA